MISKAPFLRSRLQRSLLRLGPAALLSSVATAAAGTSAFPWKSSRPFSSKGSVERNLEKAPSCRFGLQRVGVVFLYRGPEISHVWHGRKVDFRNRTQQGGLPRRWEDTSHVLSYTPHMGGNPNYRSVVAPPRQNGTRSTRIRTHPLQYGQLSQSASVCKNHLCQREAD